MISATGTDRRGFSLIEILVTLTILALIAGAAVPSIQGIVREHQAREPVRELAVTAREVRDRAIRMQRPFQIGFDATGFYKAPYYQPYETFEEFDQLRREQQEREFENEILDAGEQRFGAPEESEPKLEDDANFLKRYEWPEGMTVKVRLWGEPEWIDLAGANHERWVFQPSGISKPFMIQMENEDAFFEVKFNPLSGEIESERSWVE